MWISVNYQNRLGTEISYYSLLLKPRHYESLEDKNYRKTSNISRTLVGNKVVYNSDVVGASPVGAAPTTSSFST